MSIDIDLTGRRALVTGGGNGVGTEICARARARGRVRVGERHLRGPRRRGRGRPRRRQAREAGEGRRHESAQDHAHARGDGPGRHPRQQRGHPHVGLRRPEALRRHAPRGLGRRDAPQPRRGVARHPRVRRRDGRPGVGEDRHDRLRRGPPRRTVPGDLRRGQGRRDGIHARASRPRSARTVSPRTAWRSAP